MTEIESILAECLTALESGRAVEECLARYPDRRDELEPLLRTAQITRGTPPAAPSPDFRQGARDRMVRLIREQESEKAHHGAPKRRGFLGWLWSPSQSSGPVRRTALAMTAALTVLLVVALAGVGVVHASSDTVPGDSLYRVKLAAERLRLAVSLTEDEELRLRLQFAGQRLNEATELASRDSGQGIAALMRQYAVEVEEASGILRRRWDRESGVPSVSPLVQHQLDRQQAQLKAIQETAPEEAQPAIRRALAASQEAERRARELENPPIGGPSATAHPAMSATPTSTRAPSHTPPPTADTGSRERGTADTPSRTGRTDTPESPGLTATQERPGQTRTSRHIQLARQLAQEPLKHPCRQVSRTHQKVLSGSERLPPPIPILQDRTAHQVPPILILQARVTGRSRLIPIRRDKTGLRTHLGTLITLILKTQAMMQGVLAHLVWASH